MRILLFTLLLGASSIFFLPNTSFAALVPCNGVECQTCHFIQLGSNIITWLITIMATICAIVVAIAGFKMVTAGGDAGAISEARGMITNVVVGFVILLSAWLVIDTVMKMFVKDNVEGYGPWNQIQCVTQPQGGLQTSPLTTGATSPVAVVPGQDSLTHTAAVAALGGIQVVSSGSCTDRTNRNCTSLEGMQPAALTEIIGTVTGCAGCNLQITAGTETGHTNPCHVNGTCVDIRCANGCSDSQVLAVHTAATANGARVVYETISCAARDAARAQGLTAYCQSDPYYGHITGNHFSLYTQ